uniref:Uncharacterized protein n=1 Tax=Phaeomonas parva TaxID=124430 RepID=A0A7S1U9J7_9STRA|mmetsp:Transcript_37192/g.116271  ORF Transcript_37192/g.116271 Transcript_37192/m.116271 type:complete len:113 (+) Transcript_37192:133-471(+)
MQRRAAAASALLLLSLALAQGFSPSPVRRCKALGRRPLSLRHWAIEEDAGGEEGPAVDAWDDEPAAPAPVTNAPSRFARDVDNSEQERDLFVPIFSVVAMVSPQAFAPSPQA